LAGRKLLEAADPLSEGIRTRIRGAIEAIVNEELSAVLGAVAYERVVERRGYRNGSLPREITTSYGRTVFEKPRAVIFENGREVEWQSTMVERYRRRARAVDAALLGMYFGGVNTRKVKLAIRPLLKNAPLSKSAISRVIGRLKEFFEAWRTCSLKNEAVAFLYLDGFYVKARCGGRTQRMPVLAVVGVRRNGEKILLALEIRGGESEEAWRGVLEGLTRRGLKKPVLAIVDGNPGLAIALDTVWPGLKRQRCAIHKLRNLLAHAPKGLHEEIRTDFHGIVYAEDRVAADEAYEAFLRKWRKLSAGVAKSLEEAGTELLTFLEFPESQWKSLRTTNLIERLNQEFRRRVKTQGGFPGEESVLIVLFGLVASGMVKMRRIEGWQDMAEVLNVRPEASLCVGQTPPTPKSQEDVAKAA
jgi:transposase-like protein